MFGRTTQNKVGNGTDWKTLSSIQYNSAGLMSKQTYGNGNYYEFSYDKLDRITQKRYNGSNSKRITYAYGNSGNVAQITDYYTGTNTKFVYDLADRVIGPHESGGLNHIHFKDGTSVNFNGSIHDKANGIHNFTNKERIWLLENGWGDMIK